MKKILLGILPLCFSLPAQAVLVQGTFTGIVTAAYDDTGGTLLAGPVATGDTVTGVFHYDTSAGITDQDTSSVYGQYYDPLSQTSWVSVSVTVNGSTYEVDPSIAQGRDVVYAYNDEFSRDYFQAIDARFEGYTDAGNIYRYRNHFAYASIYEYVDELFNSDALPTGPLSWSDNDGSDSGSGRWYYQARDYDQNSASYLLDDLAYIDYSVESLSFSTVSAMPVPAAVWLFGSGLLGLIGVARHKKAA